MKKLLTLLLLAVSILFITGCAKEEVEMVAKSDFDDLKTAFEEYKQNQDEKITALEEKSVNLAEIAELITADIKKYQTDFCYSTNNTVLRDELHTFDYKIGIDNATGSTDDELWIQRGDLCHSDFDIRERNGNFEVIQESRFVNGISHYTTFYISTGSTLFVIKKIWIRN